MQGSFSEAALEQFAQLAAQTQPEDFAEGDAYDFTRCVRADGSAYGTRGKCRKGTESAKEMEAPVAPVPPKSAMTKKDPVASVLKSQQELKAFNKKENERLAELIKAGKVKGVTSADLDRIKANRAGSTAKKAGDEVAAAARTKEESKEATREKRLTNSAAWRLMKQVLDTPEVKSQLQNLIKKDDVEGVKALYSRIEAEAVKKANEGGGRPSQVELKAAWKDAQGAVKSAATEAKRVARETKGDKSPEARAKRLAAGTALDKAELAASRASKKFFAAAKRESRAAMTPEQRKLEREADKLTKGG